MKYSWDELLRVLQPQLISKPSFKFSSEATSFGGPEQAEAAEEINVDWGSKTNRNGKEENTTICEGTKKIGRMTKGNAHENNGDLRLITLQSIKFDMWGIKL